MRGSFFCLYRRRVSFIPDFSPSKKSRRAGIKPARPQSLRMNSPVQEEGSVVLDSQDQVRFETLVLPHLDAAHNLARWLLRGGADAEDVTQEAMLRAYRFFGGFHDGDVRAWLLQIVRNTCFSWMEKNRRPEPESEFNEEVHLPNSITPEALAIASKNRDRLARAPETLPP